MSKPERAAQIFLEGLSNDSSNNILDNLQNLIESLENKKDPEPTEIRLLDNLYHFLEMLTNVSNNISSYVKNSRQNLSGTKLMSLYENTRHSTFKY